MKSNNTVTASRLCFVMADGTEKIPEKFTDMTDVLFTKIVAATRAAGRVVPVRWYYQKYEVILSAAEVAYRDFYDGQERIDRTMNDGFAR